MDKGTVLLMTVGTFTGYQGLFCPSNKPSCDQLPGSIQLVKASGRRVFVVKNRSHLHEK